MANPYAYAGNNPVNLFDPAGLRPITTEELDAYRKANAPKWGTALAIVAGVGLAFVPGAQGFAAALIAGAVLGGGASIIDQACSGYPIDWGQVGKDTLFGLGGGAFGYGVGKGLQWAAKTPVGQAATQWVGDHVQRIPVVQHITNRLGAHSAAETAESLTDDALNALTTPARTSAVPDHPAIIVQDIAREQAAKGRAELLSQLSNPQQEAAASAPYLSNIHTGTAVHNATARELGVRFPGQYRYNASNGALPI